MCFSDRLRILTDSIPELKRKLSAANATTDDYRRRLRTERDRSHAVFRVLDLQVNNLESSRIALRQASNRLRGRDDIMAPSKKPCTESVAQPQKPVPTANPVEGSSGSVESQASTKVR